MNKYLQLLSQGEIIVFDGGTGTLIQKIDLKDEDFGGLTGCNEYLNLTRPDVLGDIHKAYLQAGARAIETNSFGASLIKLTEYGLADKHDLINQRAAEIARKAADNFGGNIFVVGSMGPTGILLSDPNEEIKIFDDIKEVYYKQSIALIKGGVDVLLIETAHDIKELKAAVLGSRQAIKDSGKSVALQAQITLDIQGKMLFGTDILAAITIIKDLEIDVFGLNCSTGPAEMELSIKLLSKYSPKYIAIVPNAGMPENIDGDAVYRLSPKLFAEQVVDFIGKYNINVVGGCCGTSPDHIKALITVIKRKKLKTKPRKIGVLNNATSPITLNKGKKGIKIIGERINAQGSRKAKQLMMNEDYDALIDILQVQEQQGANFIDLCFALTERDDESGQIATFIKKSAYLTSVPLVFDSTEPSVISTAVKEYAGKGLVNSINLENNKIYKVLPILKTFGLSTIALCIDEQGMAKTLEKKLEIAERIYKLVVEDNGLQPEQLIFDPLTFTLATGEKEWQDSAVQTFNALEAIKKKFLGVQTVLGISNVSFGLQSKARQILNAVYLYHAEKVGLDYAIYNPAHLLDVEKLPSDLRQKADDLIFNRSDAALLEYIAYFENQQNRPTNSITQENVQKENALNIEEQIAFQVINRKKLGITELLNEALKNHKPQEIINDVLLPAMKSVGDKMEKGELILPFVLQSAEVMKTSLDYLERFLSQKDVVHKGVVVLATVFGDVHDIGKNLVKTITANNGYKVIDLGKQVPADAIIKTAIKEKADAITLSALLVTTSKQMQLIVEKLNELGQSIPVIIGGAAINDAFAKRISLIDGNSYKGGVYYAKDAFQGLKILEGIIRT